MFREMLRTKEAYLLFIMFFSACMSGLYLIGIVKDIGVRLAGLNAATAANAVSMVAGIAFCFGGNITIFPAIAGDFFGLKNHNKNYGIIYQGFGIGALAGSFIASLMGGFRPTFMVIGILCILSLFIALLIKRPIQQKNRGKVLLNPKRRPI